jgi:hypothetical protein
MAVDPLDRRHCIFFDLVRYQRRECDTAQQNVRNELIWVLAFKGRSRQLAEPRTGC